MIYIYIYTYILSYIDIMILMDIFYIYTVDISFPRAILSLSYLFVSPVMSAPRHQASTLARHTDTTFLQQAKLTSICTYST